MNRNRNYFNQPTQGGGRSSPDYGRSNFDDGPSDPWMNWTIIVVAIIIAWFIWQFSRT